MKSILLACMFLLSGVTAMAKTMNVKCEVQKIELKNMEWGTPTPRIHINCGASSYYTQTYIDFHYVKQDLGSNIINNLKVGQTIDMAVALDESLMYHYPDMVTAIHSSGGFATEISRQEWLMFVRH